MKRRDFLRISGTGMLTLKLGKPSFAAFKSAPQISITIDDPGIEPNLKLTSEERTRAILNALRKNGNLKAGLFVCGMRVDSEAGKKLIDLWDAEGHSICNHSYSHLNYNSNKISFEQFSQDMVRGEGVIKDRKHFRKFFRFPFLKEGSTVEKRDLMRHFLSDRGYRTGAVTVDASDWYIDERLGKRLEQNPNADITPYRDFFLKHIWERAAFYESLAQQVLGRSIKHTILLHHNLLNALLLGDLIKMFESKGWRLVDVENAWKDKAFSRAPQIAPAGESLLWALAKETGRFDSILRYPGEDSRYEKEEMDKLGL